jgi:hypothetical protein
MSKGSGNKSSILELPYSERQLILVSNDEVVSISKKAEQEVLKEKKDVDWYKISQIALASVAFTLVGGIAIELAKESIKSLAKAREAGLKILNVPKSEVHQLSFPPGHPRDNVLYAGHPAVPNVYYTMADFHRITFEHKFAEAIEILMYLGASKIRVQHIKGWSREIAARIGVSFDNTLSAEMETQKNNKSAHDILFEAVLRGNTKPVLPDKLAWFPFEPTWQSIVNGRIKFGLKNFNLNISYEDDFGINAGLKVLVQKSGLDVGGKFEDHQATIWRISGEFAEEA